MANKKLFVVDAMAMAFRTYHAFGQRPLSTSSGFPTSAIFGSAMFLMRLIETEKPDYLIIATDSKGDTFRHEMYPEYKANRGEMPEDLAEQLPALFRLFEALKIPLLKETGMEADDLIGTLVKKYEGEKVDHFIVSGDKDFLQLISKNIFLYAPKKGNKVEISGIPEVKERFGCAPNHVIDILALMGDSADNVPGIKGIGEKGAIKLVSTFGSLEEIYENLDQITNKRQLTGLTENKEMGLLSKELVTIKTDCHLPLVLDEMVCNPFESTSNETLEDFFKEMEFSTLAERVAKNRNTHHEEEEIPDEVVDKAKLGRKINYRLANTASLAEELTKELRASDLFSFDTETTGLNVVTDYPIGVSFSSKPDTGWYLPLLEKDLEDFSMEEAKELLREIFSLPATKIAHNLKYDWQMLTNIGIEPKSPLGDSMLAAFVLESSGKFGIDHLTEKHLGIEKIPTTELMGKKKNIPMAEVPVDKLTMYAAEDADCALMLYQKFMDGLEKKQLFSVYQEIDLPLATILGRMEKAGIYLDAETLAEFSGKLDERIKSCTEKIYELSGEEFNINSTKQLQKILYEKLKIQEELGIKRLKKTKTGISTDGSVLEKLSEHPLPREILDYRMLAKLKNTYVDTLPQLITPKTNRIHTSFHQTGAQTGRLSSSHPNLQNIPIRTDLGKEIRKTFCVDDNTRVILSADYSQIELRLLAHLSGDENLREAFLAGGDIHTETAARIFEMNPSDVTGTERSRAKSINYGLVYGMGPGRLSRTTGVSMAEAKKFIESYFASFPKIKDYINSSIDLAKERGYSETISGRRRTIDGFEAGGLQAANAQNIAVNSPIQGSASDLIKIAMINIQKELDKTPLDAKMLLQVHDELVFECAQDSVGELSALVKTTMENAMQLSVPLVVDIGYGKNWLEAH